MPFMAQLFPVILRFFVDKSPRAVSSEAEHSADNRKVGESRTPRRMVRVNISTNVVRAFGTPSVLWHAVAGPARYYIVRVLQSHW